MKRRTRVLHTGQAMLVPTFALLAIVMGIDYLSKIGDVMATFLIIVLFTFIGLTRLIIKKKYAPEFIGDEADGIRVALGFAKKYPVAGRLYIALAIGQYVLAVIFLFILSWRIIQP